MANVLIVIEDVFGITYNERQIATWVQFFHDSKWNSREILETLAVVRGLAYPPREFDWAQHRPKREYARPAFLDERIDTTVERLYRGLPEGSWERFVMGETLKGLKRRDMVAAYDTIIAEAEKRKRPDHELNLLRQTRQETQNLRACWRVTGRGTRKWVGPKLENAPDRPESVVQAPIAQPPV